MVVYQSNVAFSIATRMGKTLCTIALRCTMYGLSFS